jgi:hypothetical protein
MASSSHLRVFLSYSSRDRPDALEVKQIAEADGHDVWMDLFDIRPAERLHGELEQGVKNADVLCLLVSPTAVSSPYVEEELRHAIAAERHGLRILPVILRSAALPAALRDRVALDARRGLKDPAIAGRLRRALGGSLDDTLLLDDVRRGELADRAAVEAAEAALPARRAALERVAGTPIRSLCVVVDPDFWPDDSGSLIEIALSIDIFVGSVTILLAPYVEGHTWPSSSGLPECPPSDFDPRMGTRVDACLRWAGRTVPGALTLDGTDLGELPVELTFDLPGDEFTGDERVRTWALLERFELPSLRELIDRDASIEVRRFSREGTDGECVDPAATDLRLRLEVPLRHDKAGIFGFRLWSFHDRLDEVLQSAPTLKSCATDLEREAVLSLYRNEPLRAELNSDERRRRVTAMVDGEAPVTDDDRWAAFCLAAGRADVPRLRGNRRQAAEITYQALGLLGDIQAEELDYGQASRVLLAVWHLVNDLGASSGRAEAIEYFTSYAVGLARALVEFHPDEPEYRRAVIRNLMQRAERYPGTQQALEDAREALAVADALAADDPLPWRIEEANTWRERAEQILGSQGAALPESPAREAGEGTIAWLDARSVPEDLPYIVATDALLRLWTGVPARLIGESHELAIHGAELVSVWAGERTGDGLVAALSPAATSDDSDHLAQALASGHSPLPVPGGGDWSVTGWSDDGAPTELRERLGAESVRALSLRFRAGDEELRGYLVVVERGGLRWRVCLTIAAGAAGPDRALSDDAIAAAVFGALRLT